MCEATNATLQQIVSLFQQLDNARKELACRQSEMEEYHANVKQDARAGHRGRIQGENTQHEIRMQVK